jgi:hypothetical protein
MDPDRTSKPLPSMRLDSRALSPLLLAPILFAASSVCTASPAAFAELKRSAPLAIPAVLDAPTSGADEVEADKPHKRVLL